MSDGSSIRAAVETLAGVGRRMAELCLLALSCVDDQSDLGPADLGACHVSCDVRRVPRAAPPWTDGPRRDQSLRPGFLKQAKQAMRTWVDAPPLLHGPEQDAAAVRCRC
jgi:hypothetical protein